MDTMFHVTSFSFWWMLHNRWMVQVCIIIVICDMKCADIKLTFERLDERLAILDELLDELAGFVQL